MVSSQTNSNQEQNSFFTSRSGKNITVRSPQLSDVGMMLEFINTLSQEDIFLNANPQNLYSFEQEEQYVIECLYKLKHGWQIHLLALYNNELIGSVTITKQQMRRTHIGIFGITIAKDYRGDGIGIALSQIAIDQAKKLGLTKITLSAFAQNEPALKLYHKLGFQEYGRLPKGFTYQTDFADEILMYKEIGEYGSQ